MTKQGALLATIFAAVLGVSTPTPAQVLGHCGFDRTRLEFRGTPIQQARCLLSPVGRTGRVGAAPQALGRVLEDRVGKATQIDKASLALVLRQEGLPELANKLNDPVASTVSGRPAQYFVIHDTSQMLRGSTSFPPNNHSTLNRLGAKHEDGTWVAHTFLDRKGELLVGYDFSKPWRATQLESRAGMRSRGRFLHVEHNQPRLSDPRGPAGNDFDAPTPGFTPARYDRSALLYMTASVRAGRWLIPAYHAVMDKGVGSHDDPQNFDRAAWERALEQRLPGLEHATRAVASTSNPFPLRASLYYTALEADYPHGTDATFRSRTGTVLHRGSRSFLEKASIEGSAKLDDGRVINVDGTVHGERRWRAIPQAYGLDALGCGLVPFRSAAVDRTVVPLRTKLFLPETSGMQLPGGRVHDGFWYAVDVGSAIVGDRIDLFTGAGMAAMQVPRQYGIRHLQALRAEKHGRITGCAPG